SPEKVAHFLKHALFMRSIFSRKKIPQLLENLALLPRELFRNLDIHMDIQIAAAPAVHMRHAEIPQLKLRPGLRSFRNLNRLQAVERFNLDFRPKHGL